MQHKVEAHLKTITLVHRLLPMSRTTIEVAQFDLQKIKNPDIAGEQYQQEPQLGFWNVRAYVLARNEHTCHMTSFTVPIRKTRSHVHRMGSGSLIVWCNQGRVCFVFGRRSTRYFDLHTLDGVKVHASASCKCLTTVQPAFVGHSFLHILAGRVTNCFLRSFFPFVKPLDLFFLVTGTFRYVISMFNRC